MSLQDALPDRPLYNKELETLEEDLPEGSQVFPGSWIEVGQDSTSMFPTIVVSVPGSSVTLFGWSEIEESWMEIDSWSEEEYDPDVQGETIDEWSGEHLPESRRDWNVDLD